MARCVLDEKVQLLTVRVPFVTERAATVFCSRMLLKIVTTVLDDEDEMYKGEVVKLLSEIVTF
jgi:hypothetical protein